MHEIKLWGQQDEAFGVQRQKCRVSAAQRGNEMSLCSPFSVKTDRKGKKENKCRKRTSFPHLSICRGVGALRVSATSQFSPLIHILTSSSEVAVGSAQEKWEEGTQRLITNPNLLGPSPAPYIPYSLLHPLSGNISQPRSCSGWLLSLASSCSSPVR